jgi:hypothetical protein
MLTGGDGGTYVSETDLTYTCGLLCPDPTEGHAVEMPITSAKGDILVFATTHWQCAWVSRYVRTSGRAATDRHARAQIPSTPHDQSATLRLVESSMRPSFLEQRSRTVVEARGGQILS